MLAKGTIVIHIHEGSFQEAYCVGEHRPFILCDYDDQAQTEKHIREALTVPDLPGFLETDIEQDRETQSMIDQIMILKKLLSRLTSSPMLTDLGKVGWQMCNYCGLVIHTAELSATDVKCHRSDCVWAVAKKALANADG